MEICFSLFSVVGAHMSTVHRKATLKICVFYFLLTTLQFLKCGKECTVSQNSFKGMLARSLITIVLGICGINLSSFKILTLSLGVSEPCSLTVR